MKLFYLPKDEQNRRGNFTVQTWLKNCIHSWKSDFCAKSKKSSLLFIPKRDLLQGTRLLVGVSVTSSPICDNDSELWRACGISFFERRCGSCQLTVTDKLLKGTESEHIENPNKSINPNEFLLYFPPFLLLDWRANHHNQSGQKHYLLCALWLMDIFRPAVSPYTIH